MALDAVYFEKDPNRPPCTSARCEATKKFLKDHYCGESPFGNGPDDGCDLRVEKKTVATTKVTAHYKCEWNAAEAEAAREVGRAMRDTQRKWSTQRDHQREMKRAQRERERALKERESERQQDEQPQPPPPPARPPQ